MLLHHLANVFQVLKHDGMVFELFQKFGHTFLHRFVSGGHPFSHNGTLNESTKMISSSAEIKISIEI